MPICRLGEGVICRPQTVCVVSSPETTPRKGSTRTTISLCRQGARRRIIILKGGPGVGKSTLMKRLGKEAEELGYSVEYHHCSADPGLTGRGRYPRFGRAMLDGTHPHAIDPEYPGAVDEIVHLGEYWDDAGIRRHRTEIALLAPCRARRTSERIATSPPHASSTTR